MVALVRNEKEIALLFLYLLVLNIYLVSRSLFACVCVVYVFDCGDVCMRECLLMYDVVVFVGFSCV